MSGAVVVADESSLPTGGIAGLNRSAPEAVAVMGGRTERGRVARMGGDEGGDVREVAGAPSHVFVGGVGVVGSVIEKAAAVLDVETEDGGMAERWRARGAVGGGGDERLMARAAILTVN